MNSSFSGNGNGNGNYKYSSSTNSSLKNFDFDFDFGIGSNINRGSSRPLKDQKNPSPPPSTTSSYSSSSFTANKPSWTHQPSSATAAPTAARSGISVTSSSSSPMVGDIFGKSWNSTAPSSGIGLPKADPNLFGDLLGSALGNGGKTGGNVPLKNLGRKPQQQPNSTFSMGNLSNSIPKTNINIPSSATAPTGVNPMRPTSYAGSAANNNMGGGGAKITTSSSSSSSMGRPSMKSSSTSATASFGMNQKKDPFGSLMDFQSKPTAAATSTPSSFESNPPKVGVADVGDPFGSFSSANLTKDDDTFRSFHNSNAPKNDDIFGSFNTANVIKDDTFGMPPISEFSSQKPATKTSGGADTLDMLFSSSAMPTDAAVDSQDNDWDLGAEFGGDDGGGVTTELEGLPPPPSGITASSAKSKGMDNYKQGQFPDAIKWLSWASVILEKSGDSSAIAEVLTCRASCFKEVGEYKKAIADCTKVLEEDNKNVSVLVQRALLYESTEKYKLGAEDLRAVLKIDPMNRLARTTVHRLTQLAG